MSSVNLTGTLESLPVTDQGEPYPFALVLGEKTVLAETASEVLAELIAGYGEISHDTTGNEQALLVRWRHAVGMAGDVQALIAADAVNEGRWDINGASADQVEALFSDRTVPVTWIEQWDLKEVPLVLIATDFAPATDTPPPTGEVLWLDPSTELGYLLSLANLGAIDFQVHADA